MNINIYDVHNKKKVYSTTDLQHIPRINEKIIINSFVYKVDDVNYYLKENEIRIEVKRVYPLL